LYHLESLFRRRVKDAAPYEKNEVFRVDSVTLKRQELLGALKIRGILTPVTSVTGSE